MERLRPALRRVADELDLPRRIRTSLLLEMAGDLEAVYEHHLAQGLSEAEAARRAESTVLGSSEVIRRLGGLHEDRLRGWAYGVATRLSSGIDLVLLAIGVLPILALGGAASIWALAEHASSYTWSILLVGLVMAVRIAGEAIRLLRGRPLRRDRLPSVLVLAAMVAAIGLLAPIAGFHGAATGPTGDGPTRAVLATIAVRDGATLLAGLLLGIGGLLGWFVLLERETRRGELELAALMAEDGAEPRPLSPLEDADCVIPLVRRRNE